MRRAKHRFLIALLGTGLLTGCASIDAVHKAQEEFQRAQVAGAEQKAPFEYYVAEAYLEVAEHEKGELDIRAAHQFADKSTQFSIRALEKSR